MVKKSEQQNKDLQIRPPVVVVLGHVDHGKTSLLNTIRQLQFTGEKPGGVITQHVGAYEVEERGKKITFIDTPGHEAFSAMRARGAEVADIALLVIDATQSVQPQTKEAIMAIKKAGIPMLVVLNKMDVSTADPEKIKRELSKLDILVESMGGKIPLVEVSAKEKTGITELLEMILLVADMQDLRAETNVVTEGLVIESYMDSFKGPVATVIVKKGILRKKVLIATDLALAKVKNLEDFQGNSIKEAFPSQPAIVLGFEKVPAVGEKFKEYETIEQAMAKLKKEESKREINTTVLETDPNKKILNIILKADVLGSLEAIAGVLKNLPQEKVILRILKGEVGDINGSDVKLAETSKSQIIGFRVKINPSVLQGFKKDKEKRIKIKTFEIIYDLIQEVRQMMEKSLEPEIIRQDIGKVKTLVVFWGEKNRQIVGGKVIEGELRKGLKIEVFRPASNVSPARHADASHAGWRSDAGKGEEKVGSGKIINLQRNKKDVEKLIKGDECGILFEGNTKIQEGDILVFYTEERRKGEL